MKQLGQRLDDHISSQFTVDLLRACLIATFEQYIQLSMTDFVQIT